MSEEKRLEIVLSIEAAVQNGSLSLLENGVELDFWLGQEGEVSRAEDILEKIGNLFERNNFRKESLKWISTSVGPGSSTGLKVGLSLAKGLSKAVNCRFVQISVLESLVLLANTNVPGPIITAVPIGKNLICRQVFGLPETTFDENLSNLSSPQITSTKDFIEWLISCECSQLISHDNIFSLVSKKNLSNKILIINAGVNLAKLIGIQSSLTLERV